MENEKESPLETGVAILIALATVLGAVVAWRASVVADASGDADFAGLKASVNAEETRALNFVNAYEHYGAYTAYSRYNELGNEIGKELQTGGAELSDEQSFLLERQQAEAYDLAKANKDLFPNRFLSRDDSYSVQREMNERWADAAKKKDLNPDPQYAEADQLRQRANWMMGALVPIGLALVFYTLVESVGARTKVLLAILGSVSLAGGTVAALILEFVK